MSPFVSIAIPFYNAEQFLEYAVLSVINQTYSNWELLLIDDGSTDASLEIARRFQNDKIRVISDGENRGLVFRLNQSVDMANGVYYARMDADDIMHIDRIKTQVGFLTDNNDVDVVGTDCYIIDDKNDIITYDSKGFIPYNPARSFTHPTIMGRREWFLQNRYDPDYPRGEDLELWLRTHNRYVFRNICTPLLFYREFGVPVFDKYVKSVNTALKTYTTPRVHNLSYLQSLRYVVITLIKLCVCCTCHIFGRDDIMLKLRRHNTTGHIDKDTAKQELIAAINDTFLPKS